MRLRLGLDGSTQIVGPYNDHVQLRVIIIDFGFDTDQTMHLVEEYVRHTQMMATVGELSA